MALAPTNVLSISPHDLKLTKFCRKSAAYGNLYRLRILEAAFGKQNMFVQTQLVGREMSSRNHMQSPERGVVIDRF